MDTLPPDLLSQLFRLLVALGVVVALMGGLAFILKKLGLSTNQSIKNTDKRRLKIIESLPLDPRRRLAIIQCDEKEHLVILGANTETVIETDIPSVDCSKNPEKKT